MGILIYLVVSVAIAVLIVRMDKKSQKTKAEKLQQEKAKNQSMKPDDGKNQVPIALPQQNKNVETLLKESREKARERMEERNRQQKEWESKHGRLVIPVAGVTFDNEDGTSRQRLLKDIKVRGGDAYLELEEYEYKGEPAIRICVDGECIGHIPKTHVKEVSDVLDHLERARLDIERFKPDDEDEDGHRQGRKTIYRADLILIYNKNALEQVQKGVLT